MKYDYVIDYFDLDYFTVFNIAGLMIVVSSLILVFSMFFNSKSGQNYGNIK